jgi:hypothetical protein
MCLAPRHLAAQPLPKHRPQPDYFLCTLAEAGTFHHIRELLLGDLHHTHPQGANALC